MHEATATRTDLPATDTDPLIERVTVLEAQVASLLLRLELVGEAARPLPTDAS